MDAGFQGLCCLRLPLGCSFDLTNGRVDTHGGLLKASVRSKAGPAVGLGATGRYAVTPVRSLDIKSWHVIIKDKYRPVQTGPGLLLFAEVFAHPSGLNLTPQDRNSLGQDNV